MKIIKSIAIIGLALAALAANADILYWNPTTTPGAAGDGTWSTSDPAWAQNDGGTSEPVVWANGSDAVFATQSGESVVGVPNDVTVGSMAFFGGTYMLTGNKEMKLSGGLLSIGADVTVSNRISFQDSDVRIALTNSTFRYRGTYVDGNPFSTGSGRGGVAVEMVNTGDAEEGMLFDCMQQGLRIGENAAGCSFLADGGGVSRGTVVTNMHYNRSGFHVGVGTGASNNVAVIRNGAELWDNITVNNAGNDIGRGNGANSNRLEVVGGEGFATKLFKNFAGNVGSGSCTGNVVVVDGKGFAESAIWKCFNSGLTIGKSGAFGNHLEVVGGGRVEGLVLTVGNNACSNVVRVSGADSAIVGGGGNTQLTIGNGGNGFYSEGNRLIIEEGGSVSNFSKWSTAVGGHESGESYGLAIGNGVAISSAGTWSVANSLYVGRMKGGTEENPGIATGNYVRVAGKDSQLTVARDRNLVVGVGTVNSGQSGRSVGNELVVENGALATAKNVYVGYETTSTEEGSVVGNCVVVRSNGCVMANDNGNGGWSEIAVGLSGDSAAVVTNNEILAEFGGVLAARHFKTASGNGNRITVRDGGVMLNFMTDPDIIQAEPGSVSLSNAVLGFRVNNCDVNKIATSTKENGLKDLAVSGSNGFRIDSCRNADSGQGYSFGASDDPRHFAWLEMVGGSTTYRGGNGDTLTIDSTGSMLCSNTTAAVNLPFTLNGPLSICNSTLTLAQGATLNAAITIHADTFENGMAAPALVLSSDTVLDAGASIVVTGEVADGMVIYQGSNDQRCAVSLPSGYSVGRIAHGDDTWYVARKQKALVVIIR